MGRHQASTARGTGGRRLGVRKGVVLAVTSVAGLLAAGAVAFAAPAPVPAGAQTVSGTPCSASARACVDLASQRAWLIHGGEVTRGPVRIHSGGPGRETPPGTFQVQWKHDDHVSGESGVPMPWSVFFAPGGIAFHEGDVKTPSNGCIRMSDEDAQAFYADLQVGDEVQVVG